MNLDPAQCYRALVSRDPRWDGRFFTGVTTTGVYCRPICPARTPKRENIRFYSCAAAAESAGFRPCLRCRPETAPGTPAWCGTSSTVTRALRLIEEGFLDDHSVDALAARLGVGARHLRRLFDEHLGSSPSEIAHTRRLHFARTLLKTTELRVADVAYAAGFGSVRRFNTAVRAAYGCAPSHLRNGNHTAARENAEGITLRLSYRPPFDWEALLPYFRDRATAGVEHVEGAVYRRTFELDGEPGWLEVAQDAEKNALQLKVYCNVSKGLILASERIRRLFDLSADPAAIAAHFKGDPLLAPLVKKRPGLRVAGAWDAFEVAVRAIIGQQISVAAATTIAGRLAERCGRPLSLPAQGLTHLFPRPEALAEANLNGIGLTQSRIDTIRALAQAVCDGIVTFDATQPCDEFIEALQRLKGIGAWTAQYVAMRAIGEPDAFPHTDLGLLRGAGNGNGKVTPKELLQQAEAWRPWRAYAAVHLWNNT